MDKKVLKEIFDLIRKDRKKGVERLYITYYDQLYAIAVSIIKDCHKGQDIVQNFILKLLEMDEKLLPTSNELSWIYVVIKNDALLLIRENKKYNYNEELLATFEPVEIENHYDLEKFNKMVAGLDENRKQIVSLKVLGDYTFQEIANMLGMPVRKVRYQYNTGIGKIKTSLKALSAVTIVLFVMAIIDTLLTIFEVNLTLEDGASAGMLMSICTLFFGIEDTFHTPMLVYYFSITVLMVIILAFIYYNAYEVIDCRKKRKKNYEKDH